MKAFLRTFLAMLLAIALVVIVIVLIVAMQAGKKPKIKDHSFLVVDIYGELLEYKPPADIPSQIMGGEPETLQRILSNLEKAALDDRIDGVIMKLSMSNNTGLAKLQEIRKAVTRVQEAGKSVYAFSDAIDRKTFYLAAACDSIFMPPMAFVDFTGFAVTSLHVKKTLDKLGIQPNIHKIKDYKSAAEMVQRENMSQKARENRKWILDEFWQMFVQALENDRGLTEDRIIELMNHALFTIEEAKSEGLVDSVLYWDELEAMLKQEKDEKLRTISQSRYAQVNPKKLGLKGKKKIAVVHAQGTIGGRKSRVDPLLGEMMGHESVVAELRQARMDDDIAAIVFRVDSPGGESVASDLIGHEIKVTTNVKPVVVSMVDVAASGGYDISYRANKIVADPMTITGSIGSIAGKFNMKGLYDKLGITYDFVTKGPMALFFSDYRNFTEAEWQRFVDNHWNFFNSWLRDVAKQRGMTFEEAEKLAHGRVWTGRQAKDNGLIDELGGLYRAIDVAKELAEIPAEEKVTVVHYPKEKGFLDLLFGKGVDINAAAQWLLYRYIHEDLAETVRLLSDQSLQIIANVDVN